MNTVNTPKYLILHSAGEAGPATAKIVDGWHRDAGYRRLRSILDKEVGEAGVDYLEHILYHWYIDREGRVTRGRFEDESSPHVTGRINEFSISICFEGHGDLKKLERNQILRLIDIVHRLARQYPREFLLGGSSRIIGHREVDGAVTTCPGLCVDMDHIRDIMYQKVFKDFRPLDLLEYDRRTMDQIKNFV